MQLTHAFAIFEDGNSIITDDITHTSEGQRVLQMYCDLRAIGDEDEDIGEAAMDYLDSAPVPYAAWQAETAGPFLLLRCDRF